jgi:hypothetical protein
MDISGFLCIPLGRSTVQLHDGLGSRGACESSETGLSSKNGDRLEGCITEGQRSVMRFLSTKELNSKHINK